MLPWEIRLYFMKGRNYKSGESESMELDLGFELRHRFRVKSRVRKVENKIK